MNIFQRIRTRLCLEVFGTQADELRYSIVDAEIDGDLAGAEFYAVQLDELRASNR